MVFGISLLGSELLEIPLFTVIAPKYSFLYLVSLIIFWGVFVCVCVCVRAHSHMREQSPAWAEARGVEAAVAGSCEAPDVGTGN